MLLFEVGVLILWIAHVHCDRTPLRTSISIKDDYDEEFAQGASTLAFVFDTTGSMYSDLQQVIDGASKILDTILERKEKPIYNYVLVPFNDPEVGPVAVTTDPLEFQKQLVQLYVNSGGDCPEMTITGIKKALQASRRNSFIYVFTDASSKDYHLLPEVLGLIQRKESQVVFVMTGDCGDVTHPGYTAYEQIASTSSGQIFNLTKTDVKEVLNFVRISLEARKVNLFSTDKTSSAVSIVELLVDPNLREFTVSLSGDNPNINLYDPYGVKQNISDGLNTLLNLKNVQIINVKHPTPGPWQVQVSSDSAHTIRATGLSNVDFVHGFSIAPTPNFQETYHRPLKGARTYLILNGTDVGEKSTINQVQMIDLSGNIIEEVHVNPIPGHQGIFNATPFYPPDEFFYLKINGINEQGFPFQRISSTAISAQLPDIPEIVMNDEITAHHNQPVTLECHVQSLVPFRVTWYRGDKGRYPLSDEYEFEQSNTIKYKINSASTDHEDWYWCSATNIAGSHAMKIYLDVKDPPPVVLKPQNISSVPGATVTLECSVNSLAPYTVTWSKLTTLRKRRKYISVKNNSKMKDYENGTLMIQNSEIEDEGWYRCTAINEGGIAHQRLYLKLLEPPKVQVFPEVTLFIKGRPIEVHCQATGQLPIEVIWKLGKEIIGETGRKRVRSNKLIIQSSENSDEGTYECVATNAAGSRSQNATLKYAEFPSITNQEEYFLVNRGDRAVLPCNANGIPKPTIRWLKNSQEIHPLPFIQIAEDGSLHILAVQDSDAGDFVCIASNEVGSHEIAITLEIGFSPEFTQSPANTQIDIGSNGSISCNANGKPQPDFIWRRKNDAPVDRKRISVLLNGTLLIKDAKLEDEGIFICTVSNLFGELTAEASVTITGIVRPILSELPAETLVVLGQKAHLRCHIITANPKPTIHWIHNGNLIKSNNIYLVSDDGVLEIISVNRNLEGKYTCIASNIGGISNATTEVKVQGPPLILDETFQELTVFYKDHVILNCPARGFPPPKIIWQKNAEILTMDDKKYKIFNDGNLEILSTEEEDTAIYMCLVSNAFGIVKRTVALNVEVPPQITKTLKHIKVKEGEKVKIGCENKAIPEAEIIWMHDNTLLGTNSNEFLVNLRKELEFVADVGKTGKYQCIATNRAGQDQHTVEVSVHVAPHINNIIIKPTLPERGDEITVECHTKGIPPPVISWMINDKTASKDLFSISFDNNIMKLSSTKLKPENTLTCIAENEAGIVKMNGNITVYDHPKIHPDQRRNYTALENDSITLSCDIKGYPEPFIIWRKNGEHIEESHGGLEMLNGNRSLLFKQVQRKDSGIYECLAVNTVGTDSEKKTLEVHAIPKFLGPTLENITVIQNEPFRINCTIDGHPLPIISIFKDNGKTPLDTQSNHEVFLNIIQAQVEDAGLYSCVATNIAGTSQKDFSVQVQVPPSIEDSGSKQMEIHVGETVSLHCYATGVPQPTITWWHNETPLDEKHNAVMSGNMITIKDANKENAGEYSCVATNILGEDKKIIMLDIFSAPIIEGSEEVSNLRAVELENLKIDCFAIGYPQPVYAWQKNGVPLKIWDSATVSAVNGVSYLDINSVTSEDAGVYSCLASNKAGVAQKDFQVTVLVPPHMDYNSYPDNAVTEALKNHPFTLTCPVHGYPPPVISWLKDGQPTSIAIQTPYLISEEGKVFHVMRASDDDSGIFTCIAQNEAGENFIDFTVNVLIPPSITNFNREIVNMKINSTLELMCFATGNPLPDISWMKKGRLINKDQNIDLANQSHILKIANVQLTDAGEYTCLASNIAGSAEKEFYVSILVPPYLEAKTILHHQVKLNHPVTFECPVAGSPSPSVVWKKDNNILSHRENDTYLSNDRKILKIVHSKLSNNGSYTCLASNDVGELDVNFTLEITVPPQIMNDISSLSDQVIEGSTWNISCESAGSPKPLITWLKDGKVFTTNEARIQFLNKDQHIVISNVKVSDSGNYICIASNEAGSAEAPFRLIVLVPPKIDESEEFESNLEAIVNRPLFLPCPVTGIPPPTVKWFKDKLPLTHNANSKVMLSADSRVLKFLRIKEEDSGRYKCIALNEAGRIEQEFNVTVLIPPEVLKSRSSGDGNVKENAVVNVINSSLSLECYVKGNPFPTVTWLKDGHIITDAHAAYQLTEKNQKLIIPHLRISDNGRFTCIVSNSAGSAEQFFEVDVLVPPGISPENDNSDSVATVLVNHPVAIDCTIYGNPKPFIEWFTDGKIVSPSTDHSTNVRILLGGQRLQILQTLPEHGGQYVCMAHNSVGSFQKVTNLLVQVPPTIIKSSDQQNVLINESVSLTCEVSGNPFPSVSWLKDGHILDPNTVEDLDIELDNRHQNLRVNKASLLHDGKYMCIAINEVGTAEHAIALFVNVPPIIQVPVNKRKQRALVGRNAVLECKVDAKPPAKVTWYKQGLPINPGSNPLIQIHNQGQKLQIIKTREADSGKYKCSTSNVAGEDNAVFELEVLIPPSIDHETYEETNIKILEGESLDLECYVNGNPFPNITWKKNQKPLILDNEHRLQLIFESQVLQMNFARVTDSGTYTCSASSSIGTASKQIELTVLVSPQVKPVSDLNTVTLIHQQAVLECDAVGNPQPLISWLKNGHPINILTDPNMQILKDGRQLSIRRSRLLDAGFYTCLAVNSAGEDELGFTLQVQVPPQIEKANLMKTLLVMENRMTVLECPVSGIPIPSITWLKDEEPLFPRSDSRIQLLSDGEKLRIASTHINDIGRYTCVASNEVGTDKITFDLDVMSPPQMNDGDRLVRVREGDLLTLPCPVKPFPHPYITWIKNGQVLDSNFLNIMIVPEEFALKIMGTRPSDSGVYRCIATNPAGESEAIFDVEVLVPSKIQKPSTSIQNIVKGQSISLQCLIEGNPIPEITWLKDGIPLIPTYDKWLGGKIPEIKMEHSNSEEQQGPQRGDVSVVEYGEKNPSPASGKVTLSEAWKYNGQSPIIKETPNRKSREIKMNSDIVPPEKTTVEPERIKILQDGSLLIIENSTLNDSGEYSCIAANDVGTDEYRFKVSVMVPPEIFVDKRKLLQKIALKEKVILNCPAKGIPTPRIIWYKDSQPLAPSPEIQFSPHGNQLSIVSAKLTDMGKYSCIAVNEAGEAEAYFTVFVLVPPTIEEVKLTSGPFAVLNASVKLECVVHGIPQPSILWFKNKALLLKNFHLEQNRDLEIPRVTLDDAGVYKCYAENEIGRATEEFTLNILIPPSVEGEKRSSVVNVQIATPLNLTCPATGKPRPEITWNKANRIIFPSEKIQFLNDKFTLWISSIQLADAGQYQCTAMNEAGSFEYEFTVNVLVPPSFNGSAIDDVLVTLHNPAFLQCSPSGIPPPKLSWSKVGFSNFTVDNFADFELNIARTEMEHNGTYLCTAENIAGIASKTINLLVQVPPVITHSINEDIQLVEQSSTILVCNVSGIPTPAITWYKNGQLLNPQGNTYRVFTKGNDLHILNSRTSDNGTYMCLATNPVGIASKEYKINVMVPPDFEDHSEMILAIVEDKMSINCKATGIPQPSVSWRKLTSSENAIGNKLLPSGIIEIPFVQLSDSGLYLCVASNPVDTVMKTVNLTVHMSPIIINIDESTRALANSSVSLPCKAEGFPQPAVVWKKGNIPIVNNGIYEILSNGSLRISSLREDMGGKYSCIAHNKVGTTEAVRKLEVLVPPKIFVHHKNVTVIEGKNIEIHCSADGWPTPVIQWKKNGKNVMEYPRKYPNEEGILLFHPVNRDDTGFYTCIAENEVGAAVDGYFLIAHVPPTIEKANSTEFIVKQGSFIFLPCKANGNPIPEIKWTLNTKEVSKVSPNKEINLSSGLSIHHATMSDSGLYTCTATNEAGLIEQTFKVEVLIPPTITTVPSSNDVVLGQEFILNCKAEGYPEPKIVWLHNNIRILRKEMELGLSSLVIAKVEIDQGGNYTCVAENIAGTKHATAIVNIKIPPVILSLPNNIMVHENQKTEIPCITHGNPTPVIIWMKNNQRLNGEKHFIQSTNGSLIILNTTADQAGHYKCIAMNDVGITEAVVELIISTQPRIQIDPEVLIVELGKFALFHCKVSGTPEPVVTWYHNDEVVKTKDYITVFPNNTLRIAAVQLSDEGAISCHAKNIFGSSIETSQLKVQVHGGYTKWHEWSGCSVTCGQGEQIRYRNCTNPIPRNGGKNCSGPAKEIRNCENSPCPINGEWSEWNEWEPCSKSCGQGIHRRTRFCDNPEPGFGGKNCDGEATELKECSNQHCPIDGQWRQWSSWTVCSNVCGEGKQTRTRTCDNPAPAYEGKNCVGDALETKPCQNKEECEIHGQWGSWGAWSSCSQSCGGGTRIRERLCDSPAPVNGGKYCIGLSQQLDYCNIDLCPIDGNWSPWSVWGECSASCNGGHRKRFRTCYNPPPSNGGKSCIGLFQTTEPCNKHHCPENGNWGSWSEWSECSVTCGSGAHRRTRLCNNPLPKFGGQKCIGESFQTKDCLLQLCQDFPNYAVGSVIGLINAEDVGLSNLVANVTRIGMEYSIIGTISNVPPDAAVSLKSLTSILSPVYWSVAYEIGDAKNGYTLTKGYFQRDSQVTFPTGEILKMTHIARGKDENGVLLIDVVIDGEIPELPDEDFHFNDYDEDYVQVGPGMLYAYSSRTVRINGYVLPYAWNHSLRYDESNGRMPYLVQRLYTSNIGVDYDETKQQLSFIMTSSISKGVPSNECPQGFHLHKTGQYCSDNNECQKFHPCSHGCMNYPGAYACFCPIGFSLNSDGHTCTDVDECKLTLATCNADQKCQNTVGSYVCIDNCKEGFKLHETINDCIDINECELMPDVCDQLCINIPGSYQCDCNPGFRIVGKSKCLDIDECSLSSPPCSHDCENSVGSYQCLCPNGYIYINEHQCTDLDECALSLDNCPRGTRCLNTNGGYQCSEICPVGFTKANNNSCVDINECINDEHYCYHNQICENTFGSYRCICSSGYKLISPNQPCKDIDECNAGTMCQYTCINTLGSYHCLCPEGYQLASNGYNCIDIDECYEFNIACGHEETCFNTKGSYRCVNIPCPQGYQRDPFTSYCILPCDETDSPCPPNIKYQEVIAFKMVALPSGIKANQELIRLVATDQDGRQLSYTTFHIIEDHTLANFRIKLENGKGVLYPLEDLANGQDYHVKVKAVSYNTLGHIQYTTKFSILLAVSHYPY